MVCEKLFREIDNLNDKYLDVLEDVCNIDSPTDFKEGVDKVGCYFLALAKEHGWSVEIFKQKISGDAVCITLNPDAKNSPITVSGHIDTVFPVGTLGSPAVRRDNENMYGPGVMDCKGGVVAAFMAMDALDKCGFDKRPVHLILQSDEENTSSTSNQATIDFMCKKSADSVCFLNLEGHVKDTAVLVRKGILKCRFTVTGKAAHASKCFDGANAVAEAASKILRLEEMKDPEGITCNCGVIHGGTAINTVAEKCEFYADIRFADNQQLEKARQILKDVASQTKIKGCSCELKEISMRPAMPYSEKNSELLGKMNEIYLKNNLPVLTARNCLSGSDAAFITQAGIPCVDCIGTEGKNIHSTDEYIKLCSLSESAKRIAAVIYCI